MQRRRAARPLAKPLRASESLFKVATALFRELWNHRLAVEEGRARSLKAELKLDRKIEPFLGRIADAELPSMISAYEKRINALEQDRAVSSERIAQCGRPVRSYDEIVRTALDFLGNPHKLWISDQFDDKRTVLKLAFVERLRYVRMRVFELQTWPFPSAVRLGACRI